MLRRAGWSIDAAMYEVGPSYAWILAEAARHGVRVRLLLDDHASGGNASTAHEVTRAGGECRVLERGSTSSHWKLLIVDGATVAVGTGNLIWRDAPRDPHRKLPPQAGALSGTREWWALASEAPRLAVDAAQAFDTAWHRARPPLRRGPVTPGIAPGGVGAPRPQVAPLTLDVAERRLRLVVGGLPVALTLAGLIDRSQGRALVIAPYAHPRAAAVRALIAGLRGAVSRGVDARLLLGTFPESLELAGLHRSGVPVRCMDPASSTRGHAKGLVADDVAVVASANWSGAGCGGNWEAALVARVAPAAAYFADAWERDWAAAEQPAPRVWGIPGADMLRPCSPWTIHR